MLPLTLWNTLPVNKTPRTFRQPGSLGLNFCHTTHSAEATAMGGWVLVSKHVHETNIEQLLMCQELRTSRGRSHDPGPRGVSGLATFLASGQEEPHSPGTRQEQRGPSPATAPPRTRSGRGRTEGKSLPPCAAWTHNSRPGIPCAQREMQARSQKGQWKPQ